MKERIHFVHGNGFPSPCYQKLFSYLQPQYDIVYLDRVGHNINYPVTNNWPYLVDEVIQSIKQQSDSPVVGVGHSLGGVLTLMAAIKAPELFNKILLLDAPAFGYLKSYGIKIFKQLNLIDFVTPAYRSKNRCYRWQDRKVLEKYLKNRSLFQRFSNDCLDDYINSAWVRKDDGYYHLIFDREIEYQIYRTVPDNLFKLAKPLTITAILLYGIDSDMIGKYEIKVLKRKFGFKTVPIAGGHMFPFEQPKASAKKIITALQKSL